MMMFQRKVAGLEAQGPPLLGIVISNYLLHSRRPSAASISRRRIALILD